MFSRKNKNKLETRRPLDNSRPNARVFSYSSQRMRTEDNTERLVHETPQRKSNALGLLPSILSGLVIIASIAYATTLTASPRIVITDSGGGKLLRDEAYYADAIGSMQDDSILNYSKLTINTAETAKKIEERHPELGSVSVNLPLIGRKPVVQIQARKPAFILVAKQGAYVISDEGKAILRTQDADISSLGVMTVTDESGLAVEPGKVVLPRDDIEFITTVIYQLKAKGLSIQSVTLPAISNELHVRFQDKQYFAKFNLQGSALHQAGTLVAVQERLASEGSEPGEYIDVRVEDRAYIK